MGYSIDLNKIMIVEYKELLKTKNLLPGRRILWENIEENFNLIQGIGVSSVSELKKHLSTSNRVKSFSEKSKISEEYLTILRRELGSLEQKPVAIKDFPDIQVDLIEELVNQGLHTSRDCYERRYRNDDYDQGLNMLYSLCDLVRINGVGVAAARAFYEAGFMTSSDVASANAEDMLARVNVVNEVKGYYKARLGLKDMQFCIDYAKLLISYER